MKKILITTTGLESVGQPGGISAYVHGLATMLSDKGFPVVVFFFNESSEWKFNPNVPYTIRFFQIPTEYRKEKDFALLVLGAINEMMPDVIINNDVSYLSGFWPVLPNHIVKISVMHGFHKGTTGTNFGLQGKLACYNHEYVDWIICQNNQMAIDAAKKYGVPSNKLLCISQTALGELQGGDLIAKGKPNPIKIICACGGGKSKGGTVMYKIAKSLLQSDVDFELIWCLPVPDSWKKELNSHKITFYEKLSHSEFMLRMQESHVAIIPTTMDTGPLLVVEALNCGTIPVCNNLKESAIPDLIEDGINGFRINDNNIDSYIETIQSLVSSRHLINEVSHNASDYYFSHLCNKSFVEKFIDLFEQKKSSIHPRSLTDNDVVCFHLHNVVNEKKISLKRLLNKLFCLFEYVVTYACYRKIVNLFVK